jgi:two-component system, OmpR family, sensor histidine kinase BaeS
VRNRLFITFLASFALIIFLGASVNILVVGVSTRRAYARMVRAEDQYQAERIARLAEEYYRQNGSLNGIDRLLELPSTFGTVPMRRMGERMMMDPSRMPGHLLPPILIIGEDGTVYADPQGQLRGRPVIEYRDLTGVPVRADGTILGRVLAGSMIRPALEARENEFLSLVARSALISSLSVALVAFLLGGLLFRSIALPVAALAEASRAIASGNVSSRVAIRRRDELGELIDQFNAMAASIEASREWKRRIISDSAHELRTPVAVIQGELEMILEGVYSADRARIESLYRETELIARLIRELGELAAAEGGRLELRNEECDLISLAKSAAEGFRSAAGRRQVVLEVEEAAGMTVNADSQKILQVLRNLISNALKAVPDGGRIDLYCEHRREKILLRVDDSGPGIPQELREKVFERFYRLDSSRSRSSGGAGLGLSISEQIMLLHGGSLGVDSGRNGGARFTAAFPLSSPLP